MSKNPWEFARIDKADQLDFQFKAAGVTGYVREAHVHPRRKFRADFLFIEKKLIVEVQGGAWVGGRHTNGAGFEDDCERTCLLVLEGYRLLTVTPKQVKDGRALSWVELAIATL